MNQHPPAPFHPLAAIPFAGAALLGALVLVGHGIHNQSLYGLGIAQDPMGAGPAALAMVLGLAGVLAVQGDRWGHAARAARILALLGVAASLAALVLPWTGAGWESLIVFLDPAQAPRTVILPAIAMLSTAVGFSRRRSGFSWPLDRAPSAARADGPAPSWPSAPWASAC
jgi:hypothetical protein